ncbi:formyltransferase family protein [Roseomonas marmotae]|uniref:Formyl transferase n=1 Tax=Roseomonas marmotae TaxID=2768161 RepID=A0ABS3K8V6_9PROT|nr:formyltransferase family protein [Roseomonas marmotae]MBO1073053.1 formyl transferase [Roseomonas marmotae]QTI79302.1 formyl transferase [Roseomonas marmotae]
MRIALFTMDSAISAEAVLALARSLDGQIVLIGRSDPYRPAAGGGLGQLRRHWRRSGWRILPFLLLSYVLPQALGRLRRACGGGALSQWAQAQRIPLLEVAEVNGEATRQALRAARPDLILSFHFDQIFDDAVLAVAPMGGINLHPALLPRHRGPLPTFWAMLEEPPAFGVTLHRIAARIDAGTILARRAVPLPPGTSAATAARLLHEEGVALVRSAIAALARGSPLPEQNPEPLPYCPFPPTALLRSAARRGRHLVGWADLSAALTAPTG